MRGCSLRYFEKKLNENPLIARIVEVGIEQTAVELKTTVEVLSQEMVVLAWMHDSESFCRDRLKISDDYGSVVPLLLNNGQRKIRDAIERQKLAGKPVRICLLKARQYGGSTFFEAEIYRDCRLRPNRSSMIVAHDLDSARHLREMSARYYDNDPMFPRPRLKKETDKWWKFVHYIDKKKAESHLKIDTAEELSTGHSQTYQNLHLSEIQNWRNAQQLVKGLFPTVNQTNPDTMIFMEGTGSGVGDYWYEFCQMAQDPNTGWEFVFVAWYEIEKYTLPFRDETEKNDLMSTLGIWSSKLYGIEDYEELAYLKNGVSPEQLNWRRMQLRDIYKGDFDAFHQQFPSNPDQAFMTSGRNVFAMNRIQEGIQNSKPPIKTGYLDEYKDGDTKKVKFVPDNRGYWEVWNEPERGMLNLTCLGADVAEGIAVVPELGNRGGDFSVAKIFNRQTREFFAKLRARLDPDIFADELRKAWAYWGCGLLIENNPGGSGNVVIRALKDIPSINLLRTITIDKATDKTKSEYGWDTNKESKRQMIDELGEGIREKKFSDPSKNFWYECSTYIRDEKGRTNAQSRKYDDEVVATAVCLQADLLMPMVFKPQIDETKLYPKDYDVPQNRAEVGSQKQVMEQMYAEF